ncbi:MAG: autotransporter-associated beta strand repeat-containing protein [Luteolibacter sp.]
MKPIRNPFGASVFTAVLLLGNLADSATLYWDLATSGATAGAGGATPSGAWNGSTTANWTTDANGTSATQFYGTGSNDVVFSAGSDASGAYIVTIDSSRTANTMTFEEGTVTIKSVSSGTALTINGGVTLSGSAGGVLNKTVSGAFTLGAVQTWTNNGTGVFSVDNGGLAINNKLTLAGTGEFKFIGAANSGAGGVRINGSTVSASQSVAFGTGTLQLSSGALRSSSTGLPVIANAFAIDGGFTFAPTSGSTDGHITLSGTGTISNAPTVTFNDAVSGIGTQFTGAITLNSNVTFAGTGLAIFATTSAIGDDFGTSTIRRGITQSGSGTVTLAGSNTYSGGTTISSGTLRFAKTSAMSAIGAVATSSGASLELSVTGGAGEFTTGTSGNGTIGGLLSGLGGQSGGTVSFASGSFLAIDTGSTTQTYAGNVTNSGLGLTKLGGGTLTLSGANTYSGSTTISGGALNVGTNAAGLSSNSNLIFSSGVLEANGTLAKNVGTGGGELQWTSVTGKGGFAAVGGDLSITLNGGAQLTWSATAGTSKFGAATLIFGSANADSKAILTNGIILNASRTIQVDSGIGGDSAEISGIITHSSSGITKTGTGWLILSGSNDFGGVTNINAGTLQISNNTALGTTAGNTIISSSAGTLALSGGITVAENITISARNTGDHFLNVGGDNSLTGTLTWESGGTAYGVRSDAGKLTINGAVSPLLGSKTMNVSGAGAVEFTGALNNTATSGSVLSVSKAGAGILTLSGTNTYTGATIVTLGKLVVDGSTSTGTVTVNSTATLGGSGTIGGATTINAGGIHGPGNSPGVQKFTSSLTYADASIFSWEMDRTQAQTRGTGYDGVNVTGSLGGADGADLNTTFDAVFRIVIGDSDFSNAFWTTDRSWSDIFTAANGTTAKTDWTTIFGGGFQYYKTDGTTLAAPTNGSFTMSGSILSWSAVPEPSSAMAGLLIAAGLFRRSRRSRCIVQSIGQ